MEISLYLELGDQAFATAYRTGRTQRREDAIALALSSTPTANAAADG